MGMFKGRSSEEVIAEDKDMFGSVIDWYFYNEFVLYVEDNY